MEPRDLPKLHDIIMEIHASRMQIREYESRLDRLECSAAEAYERRYQRHAPKPPQNESDLPRQRKIA